MAGAPISRRGFVRGLLASVAATSMPRRPTAAAGDASLIDFASAADVAAAIRAGTITAEQLAQRMLARQAHLGRRLNAIVTTNPDALDEARAADAALRAGGALSPLHGVPFTVPDTFETAGLRTTAGEPQWSGHVPTRDAAIVARLRAAGLVLLGKTNVPTQGAAWETLNPIFGRTNNPWDVTRTPGGASGGGAAALAAGLTYLEFGSDLGGAIRVPAAFCGVYGLKPSEGVVPTAGHIPPQPGTPPVPWEIAVCGPLARAPHDLELALDVVAEPGPGAPALHAAQRHDLAEFRVGYVVDHPTSQVTSDVARLLADTMARVRAAGARVREGWPAGLDPDAQDREYLTQMLAWVNGPRWALLPAYRKPREQYRRAWAEHLRKFDVFLMPATFVPAFPHCTTRMEHHCVVSVVDGTRRLDDGFRFWMAAASLSGCPSLVVPIGRTRQGLPVAMQVLARRGGDRTCIAFATALAARVGGFEPPPRFQVA